MPFETIPEYQARVRFIKERVLSEAAKGGDWITTFREDTNFEGLKGMIPPTYNNCPEHISNILQLLDDCELEYIYSCFSDYEVE